MKLQVLAYNKFPVFVLEIKKDDGTIHGEQLIFPEEIFFDIFQNQLFVRGVSAGLIPFSDLRLPTMLDSEWIYKTHKKEDFEIIDFDSRIYFNIRK